MIFGSTPFLLILMIMISCSSFVLRRTTGISKHRRLFSSVGTTNLVVDQMRLDAESEMKRVERLYEGKKSSPILLMTPEQAKSFADLHLDTFFFDCDGVLYRSPDPAPGAAACIRSLLSNNKRVYFVTNNAGSNREQLRDKLESILHIDTLTVEMMISSSYSCAQYIKEQRMADYGGGKGSLFVIGSDGLCQELEQTTGLHVISANRFDDCPSMSRDELADFDFTKLDEANIHAVVVGHDTALSFRKLSVALHILQRNPNVELIATNLDSYDLVGVDSRHIPGNGCSVKYLEYASKRKAVNVGKPSTTLAELVFAHDENVDPARSCIVGDRIDTDIRFGVDNGMHSILVLTGVTTAATLKDLGEGSVEEPLPSHIVPHVGYLA